MATSIILLIFLLVLGIGIVIGTILYVSKNMKDFWAMASWRTFAYIVFAFIILLCILEVLLI